MWLRTKDGRKHKYIDSNDNITMSTKQEYNWFQWEHVIQQTQSIMKFHLASRLTDNECSYKDAYQVSIHEIPDLKRQYHAHRQQSLAVITLE